VALQKPIPISRFPTFEGHVPPRGAIAPRRVRAPGLPSFLASGNFTIL